MKISAAQPNVKKPCKELCVRSASRGREGEIKPLKTTCPLVPRYDERTDETSLNHDQVHKDDLGARWKGKLGQDRGG